VVDGVGEGVVDGDGVYASPPGTPITTAAGDGVWRGGWAGGFINRITPAATIVARTSANMVARTGAKRTDHRRRRGATRTAPAWA
jgi:hypothetical protein